MYPASASVMSCTTPASTGMACGLSAGRCPVSRAMVSTVFRHRSKRTPCDTRLSTALAPGALRPQEVDAGAEGDHLDGDLVRSVGLEHVVGDAEHEVLPVRLALG